MKKVIWALAVIGTTITLILSFVIHDWVLTFVAVIMVYLVIKLNKSIDIPDFYKKQGITNEYFSNNRKYKSEKK